MTANTPRSRKAKGRKAVEELKAKLCIIFDLDEADVTVMPTSVPGEDLWLSAKAKEKLPYSFEVKCQEKLNFWQAIRQTECNAELVKRDPVLVFRRNHEKFRAIVDLDLLLALMLESGLWRETSQTLLNPISNTVQGTKQAPECTNGVSSPSLQRRWNDDCG